MANQVMNSASAMLNEQFNYLSPISDASLPFSALGVRSHWLLQRYLQEHVVWNSQLELVNQYIFNLQLLWWWPEVWLNWNRFPIRSHEWVEHSENKMGFLSLFCGQWSTCRQTKTAKQQQTQSDSFMCCIVPRECWKQLGQHTFTRPTTWKANWTHLG